MGTGKRIESLYNDINQGTRNLNKNNLGGVIFGCSNATIEECLSKQLFGLPAQHFSYVVNIQPCLPLFLFNYSDRKLHGIFEAASFGLMNINPYAWTANGSTKTQYPAQVQIRLRLKCQPLSEIAFKPVILDNYYSQSHFWFELDHAQTSRLMSLFSSVVVGPSSHQKSAKYCPLFSFPSLADKRNGTVVSKPPSAYVNNELHSLETNCSDETTFAPKARLDERNIEKEKDHIYIKLKELALDRYGSNTQLTGLSENNVAGGGSHSMNNCSNAPQYSSNDKDTVVLDNTSDSVIAQLLQGMEELKALNVEYLQKVSYMEQKLVKAETEIQQLNNRCVMLESILPPAGHVKAPSLSYSDVKFDFHESILIVGGFDGINWLSSLDSYSPSQDVMRSLKPMNSARSYASVAKLNHELYVFGGTHSGSWFDTVESYDPIKDKWTSCPPLNDKKGGLASATMYDKIFAVGGQNEVEYLANVEMLVLELARWVPTRSMLQKRASHAVVELNGAIYASGGFQGTGYLNSVERFDPREHYWTRIGSMNIERSCHSLVVLNEKIYAIGGYNGSSMLSSVEVYDPCLGSWMIAEPMNQSRGYFGAVAIQDTIFVIGGSYNDHQLDTVECYKEDHGWKLTNLKAVGKRGYFSSIVL
ncbi:kelch-like protein 3 [Impatiens glandulifera]|uniref:kelch-like protein 3 n=1 Tax=Impatiens glandulifera TaxID=253017 RepID=UPI001FB0ED01|nr:kelch-like protein 3 [Impatiens glandulifera]